jgi:outer membrane protein OmpA-like peptidoglycan-associated protein
MRRWLVVGLVVVALAGPGCAGWSERSGTTKGAADDTGARAAASTAVGYMDRQTREIEQVLASQDRIAREGDTLRASLSSDVLFESGGARLQPGAGAKLRQIAQVLQRYPRTSVDVVGHTDNRGSEGHNQALSQRRATAVRDDLVKAGVDASRVTARGEGERTPVAKNETATGRATNRRVDITVRPDETLARE